MQPAPLGAVEAAAIRWHYANLAGCANHHAAKSYGIPQRRQPRITSIGPGLYRVLYSVSAKTTPSPSPPYAAVPYSVPFTYSKPANGYRPDVPPTK